VAKRRALIVGITGQDGAYLARLLIEKGYDVHGTSRDAGVADLGNLQALGLAGRVRLHSMAPTDFRSVLRTLSQAAPDEIYNLSGQSSVGLSFDQPVEALASITIGTINILESIRSLSLQTRFYNAGSSECFGDTAAAASETAAFAPRSPYAIAKSAAHWTVANYREAYGLFACSGILFNHESPLRKLRYVSRKIVRAAVSISEGRAERLVLGNLDTVRDWGWAPEFVEAMWLMLQRPDPEDFVIATGQSHPLRDLAARAFECVGLDWRNHVDSDPGLYRPTDIHISRGDPSKAAERLGWRAQVDMAEMVRRMIAAERDGGREDG
jgi:GDPmannose 4,6-dehydratase